MKVGGCGGINVFMNPETPDNSRIDDYDRIDDYEILGRIGEGAHGVVKKAKHIVVSYFVHVLSLRNACTQ